MLLNSCVGAAAAGAETAATWTLPFGFIFKCKLLETGSFNGLGLGYCGRYVWGEMQIFQVFQVAWTSEQLSIEKDGVTREQWEQRNNQ